MRTSRRGRPVPARLRHLALLVQVPGVDVGARMAAEKGGPLDEVEAATSRSARARSGVAGVLRPRAARVEVRRRAPGRGQPPAHEQRIMLGSLAGAAHGAAPATGEQWQAVIFGTSRTTASPRGDAFAAIYLAFLGRLNGPRAGWLLASLDRAFVIRRLRRGRRAAGEGAA